MHQNNLDLSQNEAAIIRAMRFFSPDIRNHTWMIPHGNNDVNGLRTQAAELTSFLPESLGLEISILGNIVYASHALPPETVDLKVDYASTYSSRVEGLIYPNWHVVAGTNNGSRSASLSFSLSDTLKITMDRGFATASGIHNFIAQTNSKKKNQGKKDLLNTLHLHLYPPYGATNATDEQREIIELALERFRANSEMPHTFGYVLPFFREQR